MTALRKMKIEGGTSGNLAEVNSDNQLHVVQEGKVDTNNSSETPLNNGVAFTGSATDTLPYAVIVVSVYADQASATNGLEVQQSKDGTNWDHSDCFTIPASTGKTFSFQPQAQYMRIVYTNGGVTQGVFRLSTMLKKTYVKPSSHRIQDHIIDEDDAELVKAVMTGKDAGGTFVNFGATTGGNFKISLEELESGVSSNSNSQLNTSLFDVDGTAAEVETMPDEDHNLDGKGGLITASQIYGRASASSVKPIGIDLATHAIKTIEYEHSEVHAGSHYGLVFYEDLAINEVYDLQITTPNTTTHTHLIGKVICESETIWAFYENVTINTAGTTLTPQNNNRNSGNTSTLTVGGILNTSTANANADTAIAGATLLGTGIIGSGKDGGVAERAQEVILKQNEDYSFRVTASTAGYVNFSFDWYEHVNKT